MHIYVHVLEYIKYISVIIHGKKSTFKNEYETNMAEGKEGKRREEGREGGTEKEKCGRGIEE